MNENWLDRVGDRLVDEIQVHRSTLIVAVLVGFIIGLLLALSL